MHSSGVVFSTFIKFPDALTMEKIIAVHFPDIKKGSGTAGHGYLLRCAQGAGAEEKTLHVRVDRLA
jgi:hypothetical protein